MKHEQIRLGVAKSDAIILSGEIHAITKVNPRFIEIKPLHGDQDVISLAHSELAELINEGQCPIHYGYFGNRQAARRAIAGRALMSRIPTKAQLDAF